MLKKDVKILSSTESICPDCFKRIPAAYVSRSDQVYFEKCCPQHGSFETPVWRGRPSYESWVRLKAPVTLNASVTEVDQGCPFDCGLCLDHRQATCCVLLEVTGRCNIKCPICFADAGGVNADPSYETVRGWYQRLLEAGGPYNIQLSGGEPTVRDDLPELVALGRSMGFDFIQLNTNGLRLARDPAFLELLARAGLSTVYLQFDGTQQDIYRKIRGGDFLEEKLEAVRLCGKTGIGVILVPTVVPGVNDHNLGEIIGLALERMPVVRGVHFQPVTYFGRYPGPPSEQMRITLPEIIMNIERQTAGRIKSEYFQPSGCLDALCSFHGNFILMPGGNLLATSRPDRENCCGKPVREEDGSRKARDFVASRWRAPQTSLDSQECSCGEQKELDSLDLFLERARTHTFCISGMAFQDAWNIDLKRLKYCYIHTVAPDGRVIPFCAYNLTNSKGIPLYRGR